MNVESAYRYAAEYRTTDGRIAGEATLDVSWNHAIQSAAFAAMRAGRMTPSFRYVGAARVGPVWDAERGAPTVQAFRVELPDLDGSDDAFEIPRAYVKPAVENASSGLVADGRLREGDLFGYSIYAYHSAYDGPDATSELAGPIRFETQQPILELRSAVLDALRQAGELHDAPETESTDMPVFVAAAVIDEAQRIAREARDREAGGILVGHLYRDTDSTEIFACVSALIEARHTVPEHASLTFTPETWADARAAIALRGRAESMLGWFHSHPFFCRECPEEKRRACVYREPFFSQQDTALHGTCFPGAFQVALLVSDLGLPQLRCDMFGWRRGLVTKRAFFVSTFEGVGPNAHVGTSMHEQGESRHAPTG